uniref:Calcineurin-like phosphoesterase domain-containing protein n=1 Tax=Aegilops tauschii subsp. strangulata TaxID=200361 RepID=A0A453B2J5_AEGTS
CGGGSAASRLPWPCSPPCWLWAPRGRARRRRCGSRRVAGSSWRCSPTCITARTPGRTGAPRRTTPPTASWPPCSTPRTQKRILVTSFVQIRNFLKESSADFVVYLGDLVTANNVPVANASLYWDRAISPARRRGVPWSTVFGNHDDMPFEWPPEWFSPAGVPPVHCPPAASAMPEPDPGCIFRGTPRVELMTAELDRACGLSRSSVGPRELWPGVSNYVLQVLSHEKPHDPALLMYFLDSGGGSYPEVVSCAQVTWFHSQSRFLNPDGGSEGHERGQEALRRQSQRGRRGATGGRMGHDGRSCPQAFS